MIECLTHIACASHEPNRADHSARYWRTCWRVIAAAGAVVAAELMWSPNNQIGAVVLFMVAISIS